MINQLRSVVETLKERVNQNLEVIHKNEKKVRSLLEEPVSGERSANLERLYEENKKMLKENHESIQLQLQINKFIESNRNLLKENKEEAKKDLTSQDYWNMTITGEIPFDENHPYFEDENFFNELIKYYTEIEDYETCDWLVKKKKKLSDL